MVFGASGLHEYNIVSELTTKGTKITLFRSNGEQWLEAARNEMILSLVNNGDGIKFSKKLRKLNFGELTELHILLNFEQSTDPNELNREVYRVVEDKTLVEI